MLQAVGIDLAPAGGVGQRTPGDEIRGHLRRYDMQQVKGFCLAGDSALGVLNVKPRGFRRAVDLDQIRIECQPGVVLLDVLHQRRDKGRHAEQCRAREIELDVNVVQHTGPVPVITGQVQRFLRRPRTFDRHGRLGEQHLAAAQFLHLVPGVGRVPVAVVGGHAVLAEGLLQAFDFLPGQAQAGADHQVLIADRARVTEDEPAMIGVDAGHGSLHPIDPARHHRRHWPHGVFHVVGATADQRPGRLIEMPGVGFDHRDVEVRATLEQAGDKAYARRAAADHHDICTDGWAPVLIVHCLFLLLHARIFPVNTQNYCGSGLAREGGVSVDINVG
ncbi:hypothetical protein D3C75_554530 [compost metagenome]